MTTATAAPTAAPTAALRTFLCTAGYGGDDVRIEAPNARAAARAYVEGGDWGPIEGAIWINVRVSEIGPDGADGEEETYKIQVDQDEPACEEGHAHRWAGCETRGHGGGTVSTETCRWCGTVRVFDTWATDPEDGTQGYEVTAYTTPPRWRYGSNPHARAATRYYGAWSAEIEEGDRFIVGSEPEGAAPGTWTGTWTVQDTAGVACGWTVTRGREERTLDELLRALNADLADLYAPAAEEADGEEADAD